jgi:uncharacterized membrane protein
MGLGSKIGGAAAGVVGVVVSGGVILPSQYAIERRIVVDVPLEVVYDQVVDLRNIAAWSVWTAADPSVKIAVGEVTIGEGARATWTGDAVGAGSVEVTRVDMNRRVTWKADVAGQAFEGALVVRPEGTGTELSWLVLGDDPSWFAGPYRAMMMPRALTPSIDEGLKSIEAASKTAAQTASARAEADAKARAAAAAAAPATEYPEPLSAGPRQVVLTPGAPAAPGVVPPAVPPAAPGAVPPAAAPAPAAPGGAAAPSP